MIFLGVLPKFFFREPLLGGPRSSGPRFIEPPEPPVPTPLHEVHRNIVQCQQKVIWQNLHRDNGDM